MCKFSFNYNYCFSDNAGGLDQLGLNSIQLRLEGFNRFVHVSNSVVLAL